MRFALYALALGGFGIGLTEFGTIGLLPQIGSDLQVSASTAGYLVSGIWLCVKRCHRCTSNHNCCDKARKKERKY